MTLRCFCKQTNLVYVFLFLFLFFSVYILKQTLAFSHLTYELNLLLAIIAPLSVITNILAYPFIYKVNHVNKNILYLLVSVIAFVLLFHSYSEGIMIVFKFCYMTNIMLLLLSTERNKIFIFISDVMVVNTLVIILLSELGLVDSYASENINWVKSYGGFINPNIPVYYLFSSLTMYFIFHSVKRYYLLMSISFLLKVVFHVYARTFLYASYFLTILFLLKNVKLSIWMQKKFIYLFVFISIFITITLLCLPIYMPEPIYCKEAFTYYYPNLIYINDILSDRFFFLYKGLLGFGETLSGLTFVKFDSLHYELMTTYGPLMWFMCIKGICQNWSEITKRTFVGNLLQLVIVITIVGLFDGVINKISPLSMVIFSLIIIDYKTIKNISGNEFSAPVFLAKLTMPLHSGK